MHKKFYPSFQGYCWNLYKYNTSNSLVLKSKLGNETRFKVYITDKKLETFVSKDMTSQQGQTIQIDSAHRYRYEVTIRLVSNFDPRRPEACVDYKGNDFENCVDTNFQHYVQPLIKCNPPWLSRKNQCVQVIKNVNASDEYFKAYNGKLKPILYNEKIEAIQECKPGNIFMKIFSIINLGINSKFDIEKYLSLCKIKVNFLFANSLRNLNLSQITILACTVTESNIRLMETFNHSPYTVKLVFQDTVIFIEQYLTYNFSSFLIDIGSSLGKAIM